MRQPRFLVPSILMVLFLLLPGISSAQNNYRYAIGLMAGFGGATASEPSTLAGAETFLRDDAFELGYQLLFNMETERGILFGVRLGQLDVEAEDSSILAIFGGPIETELTYATLAGEYRNSGGPYQSGLYLGIGYYGIDGQNFLEDDTGLGLTMGVTGDFRVTDRWSVMIDLSGHYADLEYAQFFIMGHAGLAFRF